MMKKRRIIAAILILAFAFAFMAMNASAATPRGLVCIYCDGTDTTTSSKLTRTVNKNVSSCSDVSDYHIHTVTQTYYRTSCRTCGESWEHSVVDVDYICRG